MENSTKEKIERCAVREFMDKGFRGASLRKIVKDAGVTTGAFYKYYPTKEALLEGLVGPVAAGVSGIWDASYRSFLAQTPPEQASNMREHNAAGTREMVDYIYEHHDLMKLLLSASEGTRYATFVHDLALKQENAILSFIATQRESGVEVPEVDAEFVHMIASGMFSASFEVVLHDMDKESAYRRIHLLEEFHNAGWERVLGMQFKERGHDFVASCQSPCLSPYNPDVLTPIKRPDCMETNTGEQTPWQRP